MWWGERLASSSKFARRKAGLLSESSVRRGEGAGQFGKGPYLSKGRIQIDFGNYYRRVALNVGVGKRDVTRVTL